MYDQLVYICMIHFLCFDMLSFDIICYYTSLEKFMLFQASLMLLPKQTLYSCPTAPRGLEFRKQSKNIFAKRVARLVRRGNGKKAWHGQIALNIPLATSHDLSCEGLPKPEVNARGRQIQSI